METIIILLALIGLAAVLIASRRRASRPVPASSAPKRKQVPGRVPAKTYNDSLKELMDEVGPNAPKPAPPAAPPPTAPKPRPPLKPRPRRRPRPPRRG